MKKKLFLLMALLCCFVLAVGILAACNGNESEQPDVIDPNATYYTVTFDLNGGDGSIAPRDYAAGYKMELPTPTRDGYRFVGWQDAFGEKFDNSSLMPDNDLILYAQWEPVVTSYEDEFVYFKPATEGVKDPDTKLEYDDLDLTGFVYVELTSDMLGGRHKVGEENNFDFTRGVEMEYSVKSGYTLQWWRDRDFSVANGAQRFTLNYGSNFQFLTVSSNQQTRATYLIDFYVLHDYQVKLHTNIYDENPYETVWVIENRTFASDTEAYQMKDFEFDKRVYWDEDAGWGEWKAFDYSTPITQDWDLYQTYKPYTVEAELDGGTLDGELSIIPYTEYQQLPVPEKEGYDFIGWQLPDADNDKEDYFADITGFNSTLLLGGGRSTRTNVYFDTLTAAWLPKHYHKVTDGDEVSFEETVPVVTYTDRSMSEINEVIYVVKGTPYVLPEKVVYEGSLEFCGWKVWTQDNGGDYYGETFDFDAEVTVPAAMWQDMEVIGGSSSVKGLYLNDSRTFSSLGIGQRIKAYLPAQGDYTFTVTTTGTVSFDCNNYGYYATSSKPVTFTVTNEKPYDGLQVFLDVASYTGSFTIKFEGPTGTAEAPSESIADAVYAVGDAVTAPQKAGYTFVGWYDADGTKLSEEGSFDFAMPAFDPDAVYTAKWIKVTITSENTAKGTVSKLTDTYVAGEKVSVTATTKLGYTFIGWYKGDEKVADTLIYEFTMPAENVTYTAKWIKVTVMSEDTDKGTVSSLTGKYLPGDEVSVTATTEPGYTFIGWYKGDEKVADGLTYEFEMPAENVTYTAKWIKVTVVSESTTKGTVSKLTGTYVAGEKVSVTATTKSGYTFIGWYNGDEKVADGLTYEFTMPAEDVTYTAKWISCPVNLEVSSTAAGSVDMPATTVAGESVTITATTKAGYTFIGWYKGDEKVADTLTYEFTMPAENVTYTAKWIKVTITSESTDKGTVFKLMDTYLPGDKVSVIATTNPGYTFIGWYNGDVKVADSLTYEFTMPAEDVTYTAKWIKVTITSESTDKGTVSSLTGKYLPGDEVSVTATTKSGYTFIGWYNDDEKVADGLTYEFTMPAEDVTYTAKWISCPVNLEVSSTAAGSVDMPATTVAGERVTITATTNAGYTFIGWYKGDEKVADSLTYEFTMPAENVTYTAKWVIYTVSLEKTDGGIIDLKATNGVCASISFDLNGAGGIAPLTQIVTSEVGLVYPEIPVYRGHVFAGWYDNPEGVGSPFDFSAPVTGDRTLYAKWVSYSGSDVIPYNGSLTVDVLSKDSSTKHYYAFVPLVSGRISIYSNGGMSDTYGSLYDSDKNRLAYDDDSGDGNNFKITYSVTAGKLYYIVPAGYNGSGSTTVYLSGDMPAMGGTYNPLDGEPIKITAGETVELTAETNPGYTFIGWYKGDKKVADTLTYEFEMPAENVTYTAKWIKVVIESEDETKGTVDELTGTYVPDDEVTVSINTNAGYTFIGLYDNSGNKVSGDGEMIYTFTMPSEETTYTAKWIKVVIESEDETKGTVDELIGTYVPGDEVTVTAATNPGYTFIGWYNEKGEKVSSDGEIDYTFVMPSKDTIYTAKWIECPVTLAVNREQAGSVCGVEGATIAGAQTIITAITDPGYTFIGWYNEEGEKVSESTSLSYTFIMPSEETTYTAKWIKVTTISDDYDSFRGWVRELTGTYVPGEEVTVTAVTNPGYTFIGWYDESGVKVSEDGEVDYTFIMPAEDKTYIAKWIKVELQSEDKTKGTVKYLDWMYVSGEEVTITAITNPGYTYIGLYDESGSKVSGDGEESYTFIMPAEDTTYIAKWIECPVILKKEPAGAGAVSGVERTVLGCATTIVAETTSGFYNFVGWYDGDNCLTTEDSYTFIMSEQSATYIAKWQFKDATTNEEFVFEENGDGYTLMAYNGSDNVVIVPSTYNGKAITAINEAAFQNNTTITSVYIATSVTNIAKGSFSGCSALEEIIIPFVGAEAGKTSSDTYQYPLGYIFGTSSYEGGTAVKQYYYGSSTSSTPSTTYYIPSSLRSVTVTGGNILYGAFYNCSMLTTVTIGDGVTSIEECAFYGCSGLTSVIIGEGVTSIGSSAFSGCSGLTSVTIGDGVTSIGMSAFVNCSGLTSITIPDSVTSIVDGTFYGCSGLTSVTIPDSVTSIGNQAFDGCSSLTSVTIGNGVTSIGALAFSGCSSLRSINYTGVVADWCEISGLDYLMKSGRTLYIGGKALEGEITIPESVETIPAYAFAYQTGINSIIIPDSVTSIADNAFEGCKVVIYSEFDNAYYLGNSLNQYYALIKVKQKGIISCEINSATVVIADSAFSDCSSLTSITIPDSVTSIGSSAFEDCSSLTSITIPDSVTSSIGGYAFYNCSGLTSVTIPDSVTSIGSSAFYGCSGLESVTIGNGVTSIGDRAFYGCSSLTSVTIGNSVTSIGSMAFYNCNTSMKVYITDIAAWCGIEFDYYYSNPLYQAYNLYLNNKLVTDLVIPDGVMSIGSYAFYSCNCLTSVTIPDSVTSIGDYAFSVCSSLTSVTIGDGVTSIGDSAFYDCDGLLSVTIPDSVTSIGSSAFRGCIRLTSVTIPDSVTSIGSSAFEDCSSLTSVTIGDSVTSIGNRAFYGCRLTSVTIPDSVTSIGSYAFDGCTNLTTVTIPDSVTSIGMYAFSGCSNLTSVIFEETAGWYRASSSTATSGTSLSSSSLADPATAAKWLRSTYYDYYWKRNV